MAFTFTVNQTPATGSVAVYNLIARLLAAGWLKKSDSDGTTYSAAGTQVTSGAAGANGLGNNSAWVRMQRPDTTAELIIQRGAAGTLWRIKYVEAGVFTAGAPAATVTPSSANEGYVCGGGTDAAPTFNTWFGADGTYRQQVGADGAAPYGFWMACAPSAGNPPNSGFVYEPLVQLSDPADPSPYIIYWTGSASSPFVALDVSSENTPAAGGSNKTVGYIGSVAAANWVAVSGQRVVDGPANVLYPFGAGVNGVTGKDNLAPIRFGRSTTIAAPNGDKGTSTLMRWAGVQRATYGDVGTFALALDRILFQAIWLNWDKATTPT